MGLAVVCVCKEFLILRSSGRGLLGLVGSGVSWGGTVVGAVDRVVEGPSRRCLNDLYPDCGPNDQELHCRVEGGGEGYCLGFFGFSEVFFSGFGIVGCSSFRMSVRVTRRLRGKSLVGGVVSSGGLEGVSGMGFFDPVGTTISGKGMGGIFDMELCISG